MGLLLLDMMRMGGARQVAELGVALVDAGTLVLAYSAARAVLRWERARGWPTGMAVMEVIRCPAKSYSQHFELHQALQRGRLSRRMAIGDTSAGVQCSACFCSALWRGSLGGALLANVVLVCHDATELS